MEKPAWMELEHQDLRNICAGSQHTLTTITLTRHDCQNRWLVMGEASLWGNEYNVWRLEAEIPEIFDQSHDQAKLLRLPLIGVSTHHVSFGTTTLRAWVDPNADQLEFRVYPVKPDPAKGLKWCNSTDCGYDRKHKVGSVYVPPFDAELYEKVRGIRVEIAVGPNRGDT